MPTTVKAADVSNLDARPVVLTASYANAALQSKLVKTTVATTSVDEIGDVVLAVVVPSGAMIHSIAIANADLDSGTSTLRTDIGIYNGPLKYTLGGVDKLAYAVIDADALVAASAQLSAAAGFTEILSVANAGKRVWDIAGLASDPLVPLVIGFTVTTAANVAASGDVVVRIQYAMAGA